MVNTICNSFILPFYLLLFVALSAAAQSDNYSDDHQIKVAVSAAPDDLQDEAEVKGYDEDGNLITLREGTNKLICLADDPAQSNFHVTCYHKDLEPFMKRGRELEARGLSTKEIDSLRRQEIEAGKIDMPRKPMALYSLTGPADAFDHASGQVTEATPLYVIYVPFATEASTGLSTKPASKGAPWLMEPGTPWAHIMVITGRKIGNEATKKN